MTVSGGLSRRRCRVASALLAAAAVAALGGCAQTVPRSVEPPRVRMIGLALIEARAEQQRFRVRLSLENPNPFDIPLEAVSFQVRLAGEGLLSGRSARAVTLPGGGRETLEIEVASELVSSLSRLMALAGPAGALRYEIHGNLQAGRRRLPFFHSGEVPLSATFAAP